MFDYGGPGSLNVGPQPAAMKPGKQLHAGAYSENRLSAAQIFGRNVALDSKSFRRRGLRWLTLQIPVIRVGKSSPNAKQAIEFLNDRPHDLGQVGDAEGETTRIPDRNEIALRGLIAASIALVFSSRITAIRGARSMEFPKRLRLRAGAWPTSTGS